MAITTPNMALTAWNSGTDIYDYKQLASNFIALDQHDHSPGNGVQIDGNTGIKDGTIPQSKLASFAFADNSIDGKALKNNAVTSEKTAVNPYCKLTLSSYDLTNYKGFAITGVNSGTVNGSPTTGYVQYTYTLSDLNSAAGITAKSEHPAVGEIISITGISRSDQNSPDTVNVQYNGYYKIVGVNASTSGGTFWVASDKTGSNGSGTWSGGASVPLARQFLDPNNQFVTSVVSTGYNDMAQSNGKIKILKKGIYAVSASLSISMTESNSATLNHDQQPGKNNAMSVLIRANAFDTDPLTSNTAAGQDNTNIAIGTGGFEYSGDSYPVNVNGIVNMDQGQYLSLWYRIKLEPQTSDYTIFTAKSINFAATYLGKYE